MERREGGRVPVLGICQSQGRKERREREGEGNERERASLSPFWQEKKRKVWNDGDWRKNREERGERETAEEERLLRLLRSSQKEKGRGEGRTMSAALRGSPLPSLCWLHRSIFLTDTHGFCTEEGERERAFSSSSSQAKKGFPSSFFLSSLYTHGHFCKRRRKPWNGVKKGWKEKKKRRGNGKRKTTFQNTDPEEIRDRGGGEGRRKRDPPLLGKRKGGDRKKDDTSALFSPPPRLT